MKKTHHFNWMIEAYTLIEVIISVTIFSFMFSTVFLGVSSIMMMHKKTKEYSITNFEYADTNIEGLYEKFK